MDLTQGSIWKQLLLFALPIFVGQLFQNLYNSVDSLVVGNFVGKTALAAVSSTNDISHFLVGFFTGLASGGGVFFAQMFGKKDYQKLSDGIHTTILFAFLFGFVMAGVGYWLSPQLLQLISCPSDVYASALEYLRIYLIGILFTAIYNVGAGILRAVGDSSSPFYYLLISSMTNIVLDLLFVCGFNMGVAGVGWATTLAQLVSVILVLRKMMKTHDVYKLEIRKLRLNQPILAEVLRLGIPAGIQTSITSISNMFVHRYTNGFGSSAMAGIGVAKKVEKFAGLSCSSLGVVIFLTGKLAKMQPSTAKILFLAYSALTGVTFSILPLAYGLSTMFIAFGFTALMFGSMAVIGMTTKRDLSGLRPILMAGLITMIVITIVGWFINLDAISMVMNYIMIGLFLGLTAYDMQKMRAMYYACESEPEMLDKISIYSALDLYLDFINIFLYVLRILGRSSKN